MWFASARPEAGIVLRSTETGDPDDWQIRNCEMCDWLYSGTDKQGMRKLRLLSDASAAACRFLLLVADTKAPPITVTELKGTWSRPMTKKERAACLGIGRHALNTLMRQHEIRRISRQQYQIRLDGMDSKTRGGFEQKNPTPSFDSAAHTQLR